MEEDSILSWLIEQGSLRPGVSDKVGGRYEDVVEVEDRPEGQGLEENLECTIKSQAAMIKKTIRS